MESVAGPTEVSIRDVINSDYTFQLTVVNNRGFSASAEGENSSIV